MFASARHESSVLKVSKNEGAFIQWNVHEETTKNGFGGARIALSRL